MPGPRQLVDPPTFVDRNFGLLSVVQARYDQPDPHWRNGVTWQNLCGIGFTTFDDYCVVSGAPLKQPTHTTPVYGATPFTPFAEVDCSPVGYDPQFEEARAADALGRSESWQVEYAFWTGSVAASGNNTYPHLAADTAVLDEGVLPSITLQCAATTITGSVILDVVEGLGRLEAALASCYNGQGVIHVPMILGEQLFRAGVAKVDGAQIKTQAGNLVALGAGYPGTGPDGTSISNAVWVYATGPVFAYRSAIERFRFRDSFNRSENTAQMIAERTYVLGFDCCCLFALPISVGGIVTGQPLSAF
jgi:hypothetical protein